MASHSVSAWKTNVRKMLRECLLLRASLGSFVEYRWLWFNHDGEIDRTLMEVLYDDRHKVGFTTVPGILWSNDVEQAVRAVVWTCEA